MSASPLSVNRSFLIPAMCGIFTLLLLGFGTAYAGKTTPSAKNNHAIEASPPMSASLPGFWLQQDAPPDQASPPFTASEIAQFLPDTRGPFQFPSPYNTTGIRVTLPSDCGGANCIQSAGYSYWPHMSNSAGLDHMWIVVGTDIHDGGAGPMLYKLNKATDGVIKIGPVFSDQNKYIACETCFFSYSFPDRMYYVSNKVSLHYINVVTHEQHLVFDVHDYHDNYHIMACTGSYDDTTFVCTYENQDWDRIGCIVYHKGTDTFQPFMAMTPQGVHSCAMSPSGDYIYITEWTPGGPSPASDTVIADLATGEQQILYDRNGGQGHHALGYKHVLISDNWDTGGSLNVWDYTDMSAPLGHAFYQPWEVKCINGECSGGPSHPSWLNAVPQSVAPLSHQYACDSTDNDPPNVPFAHQVFCFYLDYSKPVADLEALVIAPIMSNSANTGCGSSSYANMPKGNIDFTGHYFLWPANLRTNDNCQWFIVKIPISQLPYPPPVIVPPQVSITNPTEAASVSGTIVTTAEVSGDLELSGVTWKVDNQTVGSSATAPYAYELDTSNFALGQHTLSVVATDVLGNSGDDTNDFVIVQAPPPAPPPPPATSPDSYGYGGGSLSLWLLACLALIAIPGITRKLR